MAELDIPDQNVQQRIETLTARRERECPLEGPGSLLSGAIRQALESEDAGRATELLDQAAEADRMAASSMVMSMTPLIEASLAQDGQELSVAQKAVINEFGPSLFLAGLHHGRREGANVVRSIQEETI